jgi:hypothetical protein
MYPTADELAALLAPFDPKRDERLRLLSRRIDDGMLREIAEADYGDEANNPRDGAAAHPVASANS